MQWPSKESFNCLSHASRSRCGTPLLQNEDITPAQPRRQIYPIISVSSGFLNINIRPRIHSWQFYCHLVQGVLIHIIKPPTNDGWYIDVHTILINTFSFSGGNFIFTLLYSTNRPAHSLSTVYINHNYGEPIQERYSWLKKQSNYIKYWDWPNSRVEHCKSLFQSF